MEIKLDEVKLKQDLSSLVSRYLPGLRKEYIMLFTEIVYQNIINSYEHLKTSLENQIKETDSPSASGYMDDIHLGKNNNL